ncbi:MAG: hypothetical protein RR485_01375 [Mucinivorans sp.]
MKKYPIRAAKYVVYLAILFVLIFALMNALGGVEVPFSTLFTTTRGWMVLLVVVVFALFYPFFGFTSKTLTFDAAKKTEEVVNVMTMCGYTQLDERESYPSRMTFRAEGKLKRMMLMYEDQIEITTVDGLSKISGPRKEVVKAAFRMGTFIQ